MSWWALTSRDDFGIFFEMLISFLACCRCPLQEASVWHSACCRCLLRETGFGVLPAVVDFIPCLLSLPCARGLCLALCLLSLSFERDVFFLLVDFIPFLLSLPYARGLGLALCLLSLSFERDWVWCFTCCCGFRTLPAVVVLCKRPVFGTLPAVAVL